MNIMNKFVIGVTLASVFFLSPLGVLAQTAPVPKLSVSIIPAAIDEKVEPGQVNNYILHVTNPSETETLHLYTGVKDIIGLGPSGQPLFATGGEGETYRLSSWVTFREKEIVLTPGRGAEIHVTVSVPKDVSPGGHFGSLMVSQEAPRNIPIGAGVGFEVGTNLSLQVAGDIVEDVRFRSFATSKMVYGTPDAEFNITLENLGNVIARPVGIIDITNMWGKKVASVPANETGFAIFPKSKRDFVAKWNSEDLEFGRYTAFAAFSVPGTTGNVTVSMSTQFWILPTNVIYPMVIGLLLFVFILWVMLRLYVRRQLSAYGVAARRGGRTREAAGLSRLAAIVISLLVAVILGLIILFVFFG